MEVVFVTTSVRPPRALGVVRDPPPDEVGARIDGSSWYLTDEEDMGQRPEQGENISVLVGSLEQLLVHERGRRVFVGFDNFFAWIEGEPLVRVSPDVFVIDEPLPQADRLPGSFETWRGFRPPVFALEVVSGERWKKDDEQNPEKSWQLGVRELVVFDPDVAAGATRSEERWALQVYRRETDGGFVRAYKGAGPARSEALDAWLVVRHEPGRVLVRLARDAAGTTLVPTPAEARDRPSASGTSSRRRSRGSGPSAGVPDGIFPTIGRASTLVSR